MHYSVISNNREQKCISNKTACGPLVRRLPVQLCSSDLQAGSGLQLIESSIMETTTSAPKAAIMAWVLLSVLALSFSLATLSS